MPRINLLRKVEIEGRWLTLPVAKHKSGAGKVSYDFTRVMHRKQPVVVLGGTFYLEYRDGSPKKIRRAVGTDLREVKAALATQQSVLALRQIGGSAEDAPQFHRERFDGPTINHVVDSFKKHPPLKYRPRSIAKYRNSLEEFAAFCRGRCTHVVQVGRDEIKDYMTWIVRERKLERRTAVGKAIAVLKVMRDAGATIEMRKGDWPRFTEQQPEVYRPEVLDALFAACTIDESDAFQTFLHTGLREQELVYLEWSDFDSRRSMIYVRKKDGFDPKTYQERSVPIARGLVDLLDARRRRQTEAGTLTHLVFGTTASNRSKGQPGGQPDRKLLRKLKGLAFRAKLNCGRCTGTHLGKPATCATAPICGEFGLHKFRHTYATTLLREGIDLRNLQMLLGHNELASTEKYLRAQEPESLVERINRTQLATRFAAVAPAEVPSA